MAALQQSYCSDSVDKKKKYAWMLLSLLVTIIFIGLLGHLDRLASDSATSRGSVDLIVSVAAFVIGSGVPFLGALVNIGPFAPLKAGVSMRSRAGLAFVCWVMFSVGIAFSLGGNFYYLLRFLAGMAEASLMSFLFLDMSSWYGRNWRTVALRFCCVAVATAVAVVTTIVMVTSGLGENVSDWSFLRGYLHSPPVLALLYVVWCLGFNCGAEDTKKVLCRPRSTTESSKTTVENNLSSVHPRTQARYRDMSIEEAFGEMICPDGLESKTSIRAGPLM